MFNQYTKNVVRPFLFFCPSDLINDTDILSCRFIPKHKMHLPSEIVQLAGALFFMHKPLIQWNDERGY